MAQGHVYIVEPTGQLRLMTPSAPENEDRIQTLVALHPDLITDDDGDLLLIRREQPVADGDTASGRWSLDHLFVTRDAIPVLVEVKRAVDTRLRREVVGQLLDYAANATAYWQAGRIATSYAETAAAAGIDPEARLSEFLGSRDPAEFWGQVDANFTAGRLKLVFVADAIPRELARIVEFLNDQMKADVRAIELRWFSGVDGITALTPRVIGQTERAAAAKGAPATLPPISRDDWLDKNIQPGADLAGTRAYISAVEGLGGEAVISPKQEALNARFSDPEGKPIVALQLSKRVVHLPFGYLLGRLPDEAVRSELLRSLVAVVGPTTTSNINGFPSFAVARLADPEVAARFADWLRSAVETMRRPSSIES